MTILEFIEKRPKSSYGKHLRILDCSTHKNLGKWYENDNPYKIIKDIKVSEKYIWIFI